MAYCSVDDIIDITGTTLDYDTIYRLIWKADRKVNRTLERAGLSVPTDTIPDDVQDASMYFAAAMVVRRGLLTGDNPDSIKSGDKSITLGAKKSAPEYEIEARTIIDDYIRNKASDSVAVPFAIVGSEGERIGEYDEMPYSDPD